MKMASGYNFDEAYSMDSFTDSKWELICDHVGLNFASNKEEGKDVDKNIENKDEQRKQVWKMKRKRQFQKTKKTWI